MKLTRHEANPLLVPVTDSDWEASNVFNPAVIHHGGLFHMHYRAQGADRISRIGYAVSEDGIHWNRLRRPIFEPVGALESRGVEDPRVVEIDGGFYMSYTAYGSDRDTRPEATIAGGTITPMIARSDNLISWERIGPITSGEHNKDHVLFPRKLGDRYATFHRRTPHVWLGYSNDLVTWPGQDMVEIFGPRPNNAWDSVKVGASGPPVETEGGWLMLYHGVDVDQVYRLGVCILDLEDPSRVLKRPTDPILWPEEPWERSGDVPNVVFSCANPVVHGTVYVYYGGADHVIGLATCRLDDLVAYATGDQA